MIWSRFLTGLLSISAIFGDDLPANPHFTRTVTDWLSALIRDGAARTVARAAGARPADRKP